MWEELASVHSIEGVRLIVSSTLYIFHCILVGAVSVDFSEAWGMLNSNHILSYENAITERQRYNSLVLIFFFFFNSLKLYHALRSTG